MKETNKFQKFFVLGVLFIIPIVAYLYFSAGVHNFAKLPVLTKNVSELSELKDEDGKKVYLSNHITILSFFGSDLDSKYANTFNLTHKIYSPYFEFNDLQFVIILPESSRDQVSALKKELKRVKDPIKWNFVFGSTEAINSVFNSLQSPHKLDSNLSSDFVFIIDKDKNLRGRDDDDDVGMIYGYDTANLAELNDKMKDDVKVILAEYRLALKKYSSNREI